jgi:DNA-binding beta-propeller fold protein YncE
VLIGTGGDGFFPGTGGSSGGKGGGGPSFDSRPVVTAPETPPPISGGTLLVLKEGGRAVVADGDRNTVSVVDLVASTVEVSFPLDAKTEPGRLAEDASGRVHVALRNTGELLTIDTRDNAAIDRRAVCRAPRGVAYEPATDRVLVACQEGTLVELPAGEGGIVRTTSLAQDLRDVVVADGQVVVTRFRAAELIYLDADRKETRRVSPPEDELGFASSVAWRAVTAPDGGVVVTHQRAFAGVINVGGGGGSAGAAPGTPGESSGAGGEDGFEIPPRSGYGSSF